MAELQEDVQMDTQDVELETPPSDVFMAPSISKSGILGGKSYSHFSPIPKQIADDMSGEVVLGVDEAGRGPVLGTSPPVKVFTVTNTCRSYCVCPLLPTD